MTAPLLFLQPELVQQVEKDVPNTRAGGTAETADILVKVIAFGPLLSLFCVAGSQMDFSSRSHFLGPLGPRSCSLVACYSEKFDLTCMPFKSLPISKVLLQYDKCLTHCSITNQRLCPTH